MNLFADRLTFHSSNHISDIKFWWLLLTLCFLLCTYSHKQDVYCGSEDEECLVRETETCYPYSCLHVGECVPKTEALPDMCTMPIQSGSCEYDSIIYCLDSIYIFFEVLSLLLISLCEYSLWRKIIYFILWINIYDNLFLFTIIFI